MKELNRSFKLQKGSSKKLAKSKSFLLISEISDVSDEKRSQVKGYERLSDSMRKGNINNKSEYDMNSKGSSTKSKTLGFIIKVFSFKKVANENDDGMKEILEVTPSTGDDKKIKKKSYSWLSRRNY